MPISFNFVQIVYFPFKILAFDLLPMYRKLLRNAQKSKWLFLQPNFTFWHRYISFNILLSRLFSDLALLRSLIVCYTRLCLENQLFPKHSIFFILILLPISFFTLMKPFGIFNTSSLTAHNYSLLDPLSFFVRFLYVIPFLLIILYLNLIHLPFSAIQFITLYTLVS